MCAARSTWKTRCAPVRLRVSTALASLHLRIEANQLAAAESDAASGRPLSITDSADLSDVSLSSDDALPPPADDAPLRPRTDSVPLPPPGAFACSRVAAHFGFAIGMRVRDCAHCDCP